jgi:anti-anti-sigma factor
MDRSDPANHLRTPSRAEVSDSRIDGIALISVSGVLDMLTSPQLEAHLGAALDAEPSAVIVDLTDVDFLSSAGMSVLVAARNRADNGPRFAVVADGPATSRPIRLVGLAERIGLFPTLAEARAALEA